MSRLRSALFGEVFNSPVLTHVASWTSRPTGLPLFMARMAALQAARQ